MNKWIKKIDLHSTVKYLLKQLNMIYKTFSKRNLGDFKIKMFIVLLMIDMIIKPGTDVLIP